MQFKNKKNGLWGTLLAAYNLGLINTSEITPGFSRGSMTTYFIIQANVC